MRARSHDGDCSSEPVHGSKCVNRGVRVGISTERTVEFLPIYSEGEKNTNDLVACVVFCDWWLWEDQGALRSVWAQRIAAELTITAAQRRIITVSAMFSQPRR